MYTKHRDYEEMFRVAAPLPGGRIVQLPGDMRYYYLQGGQKFQPHQVDTHDHPAKVGDFVTPDGRFLRSYIGVTIGIVYAIRTVRIYRTQTMGVRQVELAGLPCRWFLIGHFEEFRHLKLRTDERVIVIGA